MDSNSTPIIKLMCRCTGQYCLCHQTLFRRHKDKWKKAVWQYKTTTSIELNIPIPGNLPDVDYSLILSIVLSYISRHTSVMKENIGNNQLRIKS